MQPVMQRKFRPFRKHRGASNGRRHGGWRDAIMRRQNGEERLHHERYRMLRAINAVLRTRCGEGSCEEFTLGGPISAAQGAQVGFSPPMGFVPLLRKVLLLMHAWVSSDAAGSRFIRLPGEPMEPVFELEFVARGRAFLRLPECDHVVVVFVRRG
jgi:hypothetical protein